MISEINALKLIEINFYIVAFETRKKFNYGVKITAQIIRKIYDFIQKLSNKIII